jgi:aspartate racemase
VEQNPQIPDRTANLIYNEPNPTIAMFSTCKRPDAEGASDIAIPCNTAQAFVNRIQPYRTVPIIKMLNVTFEHIVAAHCTDIIIG